MINEAIKKCKEELITDKYNSQMSNINKLIKSEQAHHKKKYPDSANDIIQDALDNDD